LDVAEADAGVEHGSDERVAQHVWVHPRHPDPRGGGQLLKASGGGVPVHASASSVAQDRAVLAAVDRLVDGAGNRR
jgi:hypothetical protein